MSPRSRIPIVMFHSVNRPDPNWLWDELTCPVELFEKKLAAFRSRGFSPASLDDVHDQQANGTPPPEKLVVLSFDDGYLDNWVYVYPLLKRAGWKGTVYVNPEFVDPGEQPRPNLEDVWAGRLGASELSSTGFLNWAEIEQMDREGILEVASHSMSHTWYPTGAEIQDFHRPDLETPWLGWNSRPDRKPFYRCEDQSGFVPWGTPIHENGRSLGVRRFLPDPDVAVAVTEYVAARGGVDYFGGSDWREELVNVAVEADLGRGRHETDQEMTNRFVYEIDEASRIFRERLGREVKHFCWPGGSYCDEAWDVASSRDFRSLTVKSSDWRRWEDPNPRWVRRVTEYRDFSFLGRRFETSNPMLLPVACEVELGRPIASLELKIRKAVACLKGI